MRFCKGNKNKKKKKFDVTQVTLFWGVENTHVTLRTHPFWKVPWVFFFVTYGTGTFNFNTQLFFSVSIVCIFTYMRKK